jgi:dTDP-4-dehydrorhamnose reductase
MRVLILGGSGMLGHKLWQTFNGRFDAYVTLRREFDSYKHFDLFDPGRTVEHISAEDFDSVAHAIYLVRPSVVVNCIGIVKQAEASKDPLVSIEINALFPHRLAKLCRAEKVRLIHISTDCVFSGSKGNYKESD